MDATISLVVQQTMNDIIDAIENDHSPPPHHRHITDTIKQKIDELISEGRYSRGFMDESCERCGFDSHIISNRCGGNREFLSVQDIKSPEGAELICRSCTIDEDPPENNSERANGMKQTIKNLGEIVDDIQDKILEGEYLQMMNLLQKITNQINLL